MNLYDEYQRLCKKYDKLHDDYSRLIKAYRDTERQLYINNREVVDSLKKIIRDDYENPESIRESDYFCPFIRNYCLYFGGDYCKHLCNQRFK